MSKECSPLCRIPVQMGRIFRMQGVFLTWFCSTQSYRKSLIDNIKQNLANEMLRVLKPDDLVLWYDFWHNPTTPHARGIHPAEIHRLFPGRRFVFRRITLAPPIARRLVPLSWVVCVLLEKMRIFNTHYLVAIRPDH